MKRFLATSLLSAVAVVSTPSPVAAGAHKSVVSVTSCYTYDSQVETVPSGTKLVLQTGWVTKTVGQETAFLQALKMKVTVNGVALPQVKTHWGEPYYTTPGKYWLMEWIYPLTVIGAGDQKAIVLSETFTRTVDDGFTTYPKGTTNYDCVITGG